MQPYYARIVLKRFGNRKGILFTHGEVQVSVDYDFYLEIMKKFEKPKGNNVSGVDVNLDRINLAIVKDCKLRDHKTFWFKEVKAR